MQRDKSSVLDIMTMLVVLIFFAAAFLSGSLIGGVLLGGLALLLAGFLSNDVRKGVRAPTRWEWFKAWMIVRPILIGAAGFAFFMSVIRFDRDAIMINNTSLGIVMTGIALIWGGLIFYTILRAPGRHEHDSDYKKRTGWKDLEEPL